MPTFPKHIPAPLPTLPDPRSSPVALSIPLSPAFNSRDPKSYGNATLAVQVPCAVTSVTRYTPRTTILPNRSSPFQVTS